VYTPFVPRMFVCISLSIGQLMSINLALILNLLPCTLFLLI
jgi:hypothetical protein